MNTGAQARGPEVAAALEKVATALADASATVAELNIALANRQPPEIAEIGGTGRTAPGPVLSYVDFEPSLGFADWRCEVLSLLEAS
jgi:hypothetical protein